MKKTLGLILLVGAVAVLSSSCVTAPPSSSYGSAYGSGTQAPGGVSPLDIQTRLREDPMAARWALGVRVVEGFVTVVGNVPDEGARRRAISIIEGTPGVKRVIDKLMVQP
jgi:hypothetical protein